MHLEADIEVLFCDFHCVNLPYVDTIGSGVNGEPQDAWIQFLLVLLFPLFAPFALVIYVHGVVPSGAVAVLGGLGGIDGWCWTPHALLDRPTGKEHTQITIDNSLN